MAKVGFFGLGIMGRPMCENMLKKGVDLTVNDIDQSLVDILVSEGAKAGTNREIAENCDLIMMIVPDASISRGIIEEMLPYLGAGKTVVDMSSVTPGDSQYCYGLLKEKGVAFLDAPVSGGEPGAIKGTLAIMVGGDKEAFDAVSPVFATMGKSWELIGPSGHGSICKLVNQSIVNINICAVGEALTFCQKAGADPMKVFSAIRGGLAGSQVLTDKAPMICRRDFKPGGTIKVNRKDIKNVMATAHEIECPMPFTAQVYEIQQALSVNGHLMDDHGGYVQYFEKLAGVTVQSDTEV